MKHTITLMPDEVEEAVREYLENRGYICGCGSTNQADVARVEWVQGFAECIVEGARPAGSRHEHEDARPPREKWDGTITEGTVAPEVEDESELNR